MAGILKCDQVQSDSNLSFQVAGANVAYMNSTGLQMTGGQIIAGSNTLLTASGLIYANAGIQFPATQSASADANTLDDYEEGSWTPTLAASGASFTHAVQSGLYVKVGSLVFAQFYLRATAYSGTNSNMTIIGLPFTSVTFNVYNQSPGAMWSTTSTQAVALLTNNTTVADLWKQGTSVTIFTASEIIGAYFVGSFIYRAT
jgi:hypothetical protein